MLHMQRQIIPRPGERDAWLAARQPYFNASAAAVLWDRHPHMTQAHYATNKLTGRNDPANRDMERGNILEYPVARWWAKDHDYSLAAPAVMYACDHLLYNPDFFAVPTSSRDDDLVEIKTARGYVHEPEVHWLDQCQAACLCADRPGIHLVWFDSTLDYGYTYVERDEAWGAAIYEASKQFMAFIEMGMVPEGVTLTYEQQAKVHPVAEVAKVVLDDEGYQWVQALAASRSAMSAARKDEDRIKGTLAGLMGNAEEGWWRGAPVLTWRNDKPRTVTDWKSMVREHPDVAAPYTTEVPGNRRMLVVGGDISGSPIEVEVDDG